MARPRRRARAMVTERFAETAAANACSVHGPLTAAGAAHHVTAIVREWAADRAVAVPEGDAIVEELELPERLEAAGIRLLRPDDPHWSARLPTAGVGITGSLLAVAATGTMAIACGPGAPRGTSLVPPAHVCLVRTRDVVAEFADAITRLAGGALPSALSWIGGPSRTADLEMRLTPGVHGPKAVDVVLIDVVDD